MQKNINIPTAFKPADVSQLRFKALMHERFGNFGEYWCSSETLEEAKAEALSAAKQYMESIFCMGDIVDYVSLSERTSNGEFVSHGHFEVV